MRRATRINISIVIAFIASSIMAVAIRFLPVAASVPIIVAVVYVLFLALRHIRNAKWQIE